MIFLVAEIQTDPDNIHSTTLQAWIDTCSHDDAHILIRKKLVHEGWKLIKIIECTTTTQDDYFPPCTSLDAFREAELQGLAIRLA